jgi:hypothetical protein
MGAGVAASVPANGAGPQILTDSGLTLQLTPAMPGMTIIDSTTLECPVTFITTPSGLNLNACAFTISSTGTIQPGSLVVTMTASAITTAQVAAHKFAIEPNPGPLAYLVSRFGSRWRLANCFGEDLVGGLDPVEGR